jgi:hypothetical protein
MTGTQRGRGRRGPGIVSAANGSLVAFAAIVVLLALVALGCSPSVSPTTTGSPVAAAPSTPPAGSADAGGSPKATAWPGNAVLGINALGVADGQILAAINDLNKGIATEDLALMRKAADGLAGLDVLLPNMAKIDIFEPMRPFAEQYGSAIRAIVAAATSLRTAIDAHDAAAITTSTQALVSSLTLYTNVQPQLAAWVEQSTEQQRLLAR